MKRGNNHHCLSILMVDAKKADADIDASSVNKLKKQEIGYAELKVWEHHRLSILMQIMLIADADHLDKDVYFVAGTDANDDNDDIVF